MDNTFLKDFLMISSFNTLKWLVVLILLFLFMVFLKKKHINFSNRMLIGTGIGILLGFAIQFVAKFPENPTEITWINESTKWFSLFGNGFIDLIRMIIIPWIWQWDEHHPLYNKTVLKKEGTSSSGVGDVSFCCVPHK